MPDLYFPTNNHLRPIEIDIIANGIKHEAKTNKPKEMERFTWEIAYNTLPLLSWRNGSGLQYGLLVRKNVEKYAKGIGLIVKDFLHWEYTGPSGGSNGYYVGYGVRLTMIDHN